MADLESDAAKWLGGTLYIPATHNALRQVIMGHLQVQPDSVIICFEDSVSVDDASKAIYHFPNILHLLSSCTNQQIKFFVRPRTPQMLKQLTKMDNAHYLTGAVLPKWDTDTIAAWSNAISAQPDWIIMPILETIKVLQPDSMRRLCDQLYNSPMAGRVAALRVGGNDLMALLGLRQERKKNLYNGPLASVMFDLLRIFPPAGFPLTAPVFDFFDDHQALLQEAELDMLYGFYGKTAIHPAQLSVIRYAYQPKVEDTALAQRILNPGTPKVFRIDGRMIEVAVHSNWAHRVLQRAYRFGVRNHGELDSIIGG